MWRKVGAFIAGFFAWGAVGYLTFVALRAAWPEYAAAEPTSAFTLPMQLSRLFIGVLCSIAAGCVVAIIVARRSSIPWILGVVLLVIFTPVHIQLWDTFPVWYHLFFLGTLVPLVGFGARLVTRSSGGAGDLSTPSLGETNPS
jgi:hypothetical protein